MTHDSPLLGTGILRFVDQDVVDAAIELVVHPGRRYAREQFMRLVDLVLEIKQSAPVLFGAKAVEHGLRDRDQRSGAVAGCDRTPALDQAPDPVALFVQALT